MPGCPLFAFCTASTERKRMVLMQSASSSSGIGVPSSASSARVGDSRVDDRLGLDENLLERVFVAKGFGVDLVDVLGARRPRREPAVGADDLDAADRRVVGRRAIEDL